MRRSNLQPTTNDSALPTVLTAQSVARLAFLHLSSVSYLKLLIGCIACSTSVLWVKLSHLDPFLLTGTRLTIAALILAPWAMRDWRRNQLKPRWVHLRDTAIPGFVFALHLVTWIVGARMTLATNGTLIANLTPIATPFLLAALSAEVVTRREVVATLLAIVGLVILLATDFHSSAETFYGDLICLGSMLLLAVYLVLGRKYRNRYTTMLYVTPLYAVAALLSFAAAPFVQSQWPTDWLIEAGWVLMLALVPTVIGHSLINGAFRDFRGQVVAIVNMSQFVFAGFFAWVALGERPGSPFYLAATMVVGASCVAIGVDRKLRRTKARPPEITPEVAVV